MSIWLPAIAATLMTIGSIFAISFLPSMRSTVRIVRTRTPTLVSIAGAALVATAGVGLTAFGYFIASTVN
jgi:hypothetical protein